MATLDTRRCVKEGSERGSLLWNRWKWAASFRFARIGYRILVLSISKSSMGFQAGSAVPHIEEATDADLGSATEDGFSIYGWVLGVCLRRC